MLTPKKRSDSWREALKFINHCPICSQAYNPDNAQLFAKNDTASLVHIACGNCQSSFVAMILMLGQGLSSVGMVSDLNFPDAQRLHKSGPLTVDEAIEGYKLIQDEKYFHSLILNGK